jgi:uncharacterized protein (TIGR01777 family)
VRSAEDGNDRVVAITGSSGLIGSALVHSLTTGGYVVRHLVRRPARDESEVAWDPQRGTIDTRGLAGVDAVVNLAGEKIDQRWNDDVKERIRSSRVKGTTLLAATLASLDPKPRVLVSGSAIGIYGDRGDDMLDESSATGDDFLASVCKEWEAATDAAGDAGIRVVHSRTGIVLAKESGALPRMTMPFRFGVGGKLGSGEQWMSWIAITDVVGAIMHALTDESMHGPMNLVAPNPVRNEEMTQALAHELHRPAMLPVPRVAMKVLLGEMGEAAVLASQRVSPRALITAGYQFALPTLEQALAAIL